jgi:signal transduction histidine kinase
MRISHKVFLVGGIPIAIAAAIAVAAMMLMGESDRARSAAMLASDIHRSVVAARDASVAAQGSDRTRFQDLARSHSEEAKADLQRLAGMVRDAAQATAIEATQETLGRFADDMRRLSEIDLGGQGAAGPTEAASAAIENARGLDAMLGDDAARIGALARNILIFGAAAGLLLGSLTGLAVGRSITRPLKELQQRMVELAGNARAGPIAGFDRRDELGDMARATNVFIAEIGRRERALRRSKDRADAALSELKEAQASLIQAEKLASLGQLVAGVAHEINTPLGIALTTSTQIDGETKRFAEAAATGRLQRSALERFVARMREGSELVFANLTRAADLVHSFKQVAADQASGERRRFEMDAWLHDLFTSLGPVLRKGQHEVAIACPPGILVDTFPGALGQVLTNLLMNAVAHGYGEGQAGRLALTVTEPDAGTLRIVFSDDGRGIPPQDIGKVFDPFFTTGRSSGSTGLGLHIVYNLVTSLLQGRIELASAPGRGTSVTIDIPKSVTEPAEAADERRSQRQSA